MFPSQIFIAFAHHIVFSCDVLLWLKFYGWLGFGWGPRVSFFVAELDWLHPFALSSFSSEISASLTGESLAVPVIGYGFSLLSLWLYALCNRRLCDWHSQIIACFGKEVLDFAMISGSFAQFKTFEYHIIDSFTTITRQDGLRDISYEDTVKQSPESWTSTFS